VKLLGKRALGNTGQRLCPLSPQEEHVPKLSTGKTKLSPNIRERAPMTAYAKGYHDGWLSCLEKYNRLEEAFSTLLDEAECLAEPAGYGLTNQGDYWLGYHHGRATAKSCLTKHDLPELRRAA
jgi:hypothetical protein